MPEGSVLVVGGTGGLGRQIARHYVDRGVPTVITGRDADRAQEVAAELGETASGRALDLSKPETIADSLDGIGTIAHAVLAAIARDNNPVREYTIPGAVYLTTMKLVGYTETIHALIPSFTDDSSVVLFGGRAKDRPYPGSTTVTTVNGGISTLIRTLALELAPVRFNAIHPGIVGDSPFWKEKDLSGVVARTPTGRLVTMAEIVQATAFLLENRGVNGVNLYVDAGWMLT